MMQKKSEKGVTIRNIRDSAFGGLSGREGNRIRQGTKI
jgi:hypothetical protein